MSDVMMIIDRLTGTLIVEDDGQLPHHIRRIMARRVGAGQALACAQPAMMLPPPRATPPEIAAGPCVRVAGYWHDSLIEGPGRRSTVKVQGCPIRCRGCITPESWDPAGGALVPVERLADALLDPRHQRDGVSLVGGEPFGQPEGLWALVCALRARGCPHILAYSGFTYERLRQLARRRPAIGAVLDAIDILIDGPFVATLTERAGPWTGSRNQRVIDLTATRRTGQVVSLEGVG